MFRYGSSPAGSWRPGAFMFSFSPRRGACSSPQPFPHRPQREERKSLATFRLSSAVPILILVLLLFPAFSAQVHAGTFTDALGRKVDLPDSPRRIVSLAPHLTEILFAIGAGDRVVGATAFCDYPEAARRVPRIGGFSDPSIELVLAARPDVVIATLVGNRRESVEELIRLGLPVYVSGAEAIGEIPREVRRIGAVAGAVQGGETAARRMETALAEIARRTFGRPRVAVYYQLWDQPLMTVSDGSFIHDAIRLAGGRNVFAGLPVANPRVGLEAVVAARPEVMILSGMGKEGAGLASRWSRYATIPAVAAGRIHIMNSDLLHRPGPRVIEGVEQLARWIHPEAFSDRPGR
ncbi:MAG: cobalamin-binding protein [Nitrospirae bacterium]|nr:cobalamin-binding protein [Nitrospirota bacterium]